MMTKNNSRERNSLSKEQFEIAANMVRNNILSFLPEMISYKKDIQKEVLEIATHQEIEDVRNRIYSQSLVDKLTSLATKQWQNKTNIASLYCVAMAIGTIIKEYEWGIKWVTPNGLYELASQIANKNQTKQRAIRR